MARLATRRGGPRRTAVARTPFWVPIEGHHTDGEWRFLPTGATHRQTVEQVDAESGMAVYTDGQYEAKGWVPFHKVAGNDERRRLLPENFAEMMQDQKAAPKPSRAMLDAISKMDKAKANA